jgi:hypothetical protein
MNSGPGPLWRQHLESPPDNSTPPVATAPAAPDNSPSVVRFLSCRWRKAAEDGIPDHCTHRDVLPMAGKEGFSADSWCADCALYKAKRTPRKREEQQPGSSNDDWRFRY